MLPSDPRMFLSLASRAMIVSTSPQLLLKTGRRVQVDTGMVRTTSQPLLSWAAWGGHSLLLRTGRRSDSAAYVADYEFRAPPQSWLAYALWSQVWAAGPHMFSSDVDGACSRRQKQLVTVHGCSDPGWQVQKQLFPRSDWCSVRYWPPQSCILRVGCKCAVCRPQLPRRCFRELP